MVDLSIAMLVHQRVDSVTKIVIAQISADLEGQSTRCHVTKSWHRFPVLKGQPLGMLFFFLKNSSHIGVSINSRVAFACLCNQTSQWKVHEPLHFSTCTHDFIIFPIPEGKSILRISWHRGTIL